MTSEAVALVASIIAAISSLTAVTMSARSNTRNELAKWRRDEERQLLAQLTRRTDLILLRLGDVESSKRLAEDSGDVDQQRRSDEMIAAFDEVINLFDAMASGVTELELIGGRRVVDSALSLMSGIESLCHWSRPAAPNDVVDFYAEHRNIGTLRRRLIVEARRELSVERHVLPGKLRSIVSSRFKTPSES